MIFIDIDNKVIKAPVLSNFVAKTFYSALLTVEDKKALQKIPDDELGKWFKEVVSVRLESREFIDKAHESQRDKTIAVVTVELSFFKPTGYSTTYWVSSNSRGAAAILAYNQLEECEKQCLNYIRVATGKRGNGRWLKMRNNNDLS